MSQEAVEHEIDVLESTLSHLRGIVEDCQDSPYFNDRITNWEIDIEELEARLEELYEIENDFWAEEIKAQKNEYFRSVI